MVSLLKRIDAEGKDVGDLEKLSLRNRFAARTPMF
jgi:hypothetical protein